jgi:hypothetical protein
MQIAYLFLGRIQGVPELAPQRKQVCADNKRDSKLTKINFLLAQKIKRVIRIKKKIGGFY